MDTSASARRLDPVDCIVRRKQRIDHVGLVEQGQQVIDGDVKGDTGPFGATAKAEHLQAAPDDGWVIKRVAIVIPGPPTLQPVGIADGGTGPAHRAWGDWCGVGVGVGVGVVVVVVVGDGVMPHGRGGGVRRSNLLWPQPPGRGLWRALGAREGKSVIRRDSLKWVWVMLPPIRNSPRE